MNDKRTNAWILSAVIAVIVITTMTIGGELYSPFKDWLKSTFYHHWIGKGVLSFLGFFLLAFILARFPFLEHISVRGFLLLLVWITLLGALVLSGFFTYEYFLHH